MALIIKINRPFGVQNVNIHRGLDFGRRGELAVDVPCLLADQLSGKTVPDYRRIYTPDAPKGNHSKPVVEPVADPVAEVNAPRANQAKDPNATKLTRSLNGTRKPRVKKAK